MTIICTSDLSTVQFNRLQIQDKSTSLVNMAERISPAPAPNSLDGSVSSKQSGKTNNNRVSNMYILSSSNKVKKLWFIDMCTCHSVYTNSTKFQNFGKSASAASIILHDDDFHTGTDGADKCL